MLKKFRDYFLIKKSGLFDADYYLSAYQDVKIAEVDPLYHFVNFGWKEGRNPSEDFNTDYYLDANPEIVDFDINPLVHFIKTKYKPESKSISMFEKNKNSDNTKLIKQDNLNHNVNEQNNEYKKRRKNGIIRFLFDRLMLDIKKAKHFTQQYGLIGLLRKLNDRFIKNSSSKLSGFHDIELFTDVDLDETKQEQLLLKPLNIYYLPNPTKRLNLIIDNLDENSYFLIIFLALLANEWKCKIRLITRMSFAKKSIVSSVLRSEDLKISNIEFSYLPAGSSKIFISVYDNEFFLVNSLTSLSSLAQNFDLKKCVYICENLEKLRTEMQEDEILSGLVNKNSILMIITKSINENEKSKIEKEVFSKRIIQIDPNHIKSSWKQIYPIMTNHFEINN